ncbi:MAG: LysR family transcriptional regulator [Atopobiaceae bacterium]|nr:LysR family transcriptional regulator [Atopobiaceae bacterium]
MELRTLRYYLAVCESGSMTRAAERLHVTQPTLSRQISDLERELDCELLVRHSRSVEPTEEGLHLMARAADIVSLADLTEAEYRNNGQVVAGDVRIACGESSGIAPIASCAREFRVRHPQVRFRLHSGNADYVVERLERGLDEFAILFSYPGVDRYEHVRLPHTDAWGIYLPESDPLAAKGAISPEDLDGLPLIVSEQALETDELSAWFGESLPHVELAATYTLAYNATVLVREGAGYMLGLDALAPTGPGTGLEFRPLWPPIVAYIDLAWRRGQKLSNAASLFLEELKSAIGDTSSQSKRSVNVG